MIALNFTCVKVTICMYKDAISSQNCYRQHICNLYCFHSLSSRRLYKATYGAQHNIRITPSMMCVFFPFTYSQMSTACVLHISSNSNILYMVTYISFVYGWCVRSHKFVVKSAWRPVCERAASVKCITRVRLERISWNVNDFWLLDK